MNSAVPLSAVGHIRLTYEDYLTLPDDGKRYEIIDGGLAVTPSPATRHQTASRRIQHKLMSALEDTGRGFVFDAPMDLILDKENVVQPDLVYISAENKKIIERKNIQGVPDLLVEILSPSTRRRDVLVKSVLYARFGVPSYWIVDPEIDRIETFQLENGSYKPSGVFSAPEVMHPPEFPDVELPLDYVFA